jgi:hypothetical protein
MTNASALTWTQRRRLKGALSKNEKLVWTGLARPDPELRASASEWGNWLFFVVFSTFIIFWMAAAWPRIDAAPDRDVFWVTFDRLMALSGLPFLFMGLNGMRFTPWTLARRTAAIYAITNRRAIVVNGFRPHRVRSYAMETLDRIECIEHADGSGDIVFLTEEHQDPDGIWWTTDYGFLAVDDVRTLEKLLRGSCPAPVNRDRP